MPSMKHLRRSLLLPLALLFTASSLAAKSYYVSSSTGNDRNAGTIAAAPWKTIGKVNQLDLVAGDRIFLKSGDKFLDAGLVFLPTDRGAADNPIVVDIYDGTARAIIMAPPDQQGVNIYNTGGITLRSLYLLGQGPAQSAATERVGLSLWCALKDGSRKSGLRFENLLIKWFFKGISIGADDPSFSGFQDVTVADCTVESCLADGIVSSGYTKGGRERQSHRNLQILRTTVSKCYGDPTLKGPHSGSGIIMAGTNGGLIDQCVAHDNGGGTNDNSGGGPVGIWCWGCHKVTIQHCLVYNQKTTPGAQDGGGFDIDGGATDCTIQYCYSYNNEGYGYLVCEFEGATPLTGAVVRYNISNRDGRARNQSGLGIWNGNPGIEHCRDVVFHNNVVVCDETADSVVKLGFESHPISAVFHNNIFARTAGGKFVNLDRHTDTLVFKGNLYWSMQEKPEWTWGTNTYASLDEWRAAPGQPEMNYGKPVGLYADPQLADLSHGFAATTIDQLAKMTAFLTAKNSPVIGAGLDLALDEFGHLASGSHDFRGTPTPRGAGNIGAYEQ